jgi:ATP-dependent Clp protease adaptor protein ClpS
VLSRGPLKIDPKTLASTRPATYDVLQGMVATKIKRSESTKTGRKARTEPPWNVVLHNDWENSMPRVVIILKKTIPGMSIKRATAIMYEAHSKGQAVVKRCHKELAELYQERLQGEGLTVSIEPAR